MDPRVHPDQLELPGLPSRTEDRYRDDPFGRAAGYESAGPLAVITRDQLHPPFVDSDEIWADGGRWYEGAVRHVEQAAELCAFEAGQMVLDVGAGLGGPARTLVKRYGVEVIAIVDVEDQLRSLKRLNRKRRLWTQSIRPGVHDANHGLPVNRVDRVWSMNMLYHLRDHQEFVRECRRVLPKSGILLIDDWMYTDRASTEAERCMAFHFYAKNVARARTLLRTLSDHRFAVLDIIDCGIVARTLFAHYFREIFDRDFRPRFVEVDPKYGAQTADDYVAAMEDTIELYRKEELTYLQIAARAV